MTTFGYTGRLIVADLSKGTTKVEPLNMEWARQYIGGTGLATRYLYDEIDASTKPLDAKNPLIFMTGPLCGSRSITSGRHQVVSLSPLTGIFGESDAGGAWGDELKKAGFDGVLVRGKSSKPVYLWVTDDKIELRSAEKTWELDAYEFEPVIRQETHPKAVAACVGSAAAKGALISGIMHDGVEGRAAGRCGLGGIMADKKLQAIVVRGEGKVPIFDDEALKKLVKPHALTAKDRLKDMRKYGTARMIQPAEQHGTSPLQNWKYPDRWIEGAEKISGPAQVEKGIIVKAYFCRKCVIGCGNTIEVKEGPYKTVKGGGPEYETVNLFGGNCLVDSPEAICLANELCNRYGLDTVDAGALVGYAMETFEAGIITESDTGGVALKFGDADAMLECVRMMGENKHIGAVLNKGFNHVVDQFPASELFAIHVKGLGIPAHDPRGYNGLACSYATSNRGAHHTSGQTHLYEHRLEVPEINHKPAGRFETEGKGALAAYTQNIMNVLDSAKSCKFAQNGGWTIGPITEALKHVTGWEQSIDDLIFNGERCFNLKRLINRDRGYTRKEDRLPKRMLTLPRTAEGHTPNIPPLEKMLDEYYDARGWSQDGIPLQETIDRLELPVKG